MAFFTFTAYAKKKFLKLPKDVQGRILRKLLFLKEHEDIFTVLRKMTDFEPATHRLRIGNYRLILQFIGQQKSEMDFFVLDVGHRKTIYR